MLLNYKQVGLWAVVIVVAVLGALWYRQAPSPIAAQSPQKEIVLPIVWNDYGTQMQKLDIIDAEKMPVTISGPRITMTKENSHELLNLFWAFGLANKNQILEQGPMMDPRYGGAKGFASTGGWSLAVGDPMDHYNMYAMVTLTADQQALVERVSRGIYRPCCDNSTYFPDCNHGMAMLGLLELMAAQNVSEQDMYKNALGVNQFWFPKQYTVIGQYLAKQKIAASPKEILSAQYSSASGYAKVVAALQPKQQSVDGSCGV